MLAFVAYDVCVNLDRNKRALLMSRCVCALTFYRAACLAALFIYSSIICVADRAYSYILNYDIASVYLYLHCTRFIFLR